MFNYLTQNKALVVITCICVICVILLMLRNHNNRIYVGNFTVVGKDNVRHTGYQTRVVEYRLYGNFVDDNNKLIINDTYIEVSKLDYDNIREGTTLRAVCTNINKWLHFNLYDEETYS